MKTKLSWFENKIVFRMSRLIYIILSSMALLAIIFGVLLFGYGISPTSKGTEIQQPVTIYPEPVTIDHVKGAIPKQVEPLPSRTAGESPAKSDDTPGPTDVLMAQMKEFFGGKGYPWDSIVTKKCTSYDYWYEQCDSWRTYVSKEGVESRLKKVTKAMSSYAALDFLKVNLKLMPLFDITHVEEFDPQVKENSKAMAGYKKKLFDDRSKIVTVTSKIASAYGGVDDQIQAQLITMLSVQGKPYGDGNPANDSQEKNNIVAVQIAHRQYLVDWILDLNMDDSVSSQLSAVLSLWPSLAFRLPDATRVKGMVYVWDEIKKAPIIETQALLNEFESVSSQLQSDDVLAGWQALQRLKLQRAYEAKQQNEANMDSYYAAVAVQENHYRETLETKGEKKGQSLRVIGTGIGAVALLGLILAALAIERHTRMLQVVSERLLQTSNHLRDNWREYSESVGGNVFTKAEHMEPVLSQPPLSPSPQQLSTPAKPVSMDNNRHPAA